MNGVNNQLEPIASVILPVYNAKKYLAQAIESVLSQTFKNFELLLLNDGSTDNSLEILKYYAAHDNRCSVFSWPNRGLVKTLNEGIRLAKSEIILRMDADDICIYSRFEKQIDYLSRHPECVAIGSKVLLIDDEGLPISEFSLALSHEDIDQDHLVGLGGSICHPAAAIRKMAIIRIGGYRDRYKHAEDLDLFLRLAEIGKLANLPNILLKYRQHVDSIGYTKKVKQLRSSVYAVNDACKRRGIEKQNILRRDVKKSAKKTTIADIHRKWGWWALAEGNLKTAKKHTFKAIKNGPLNIKSLRLLACVIRGH